MRQNHIGQKNIFFLVAALGGLFDVSLFFLFRSKQGGGYVTCTFGGSTLVGLFDIRLLFFLRLGRQTFKLCTL